MGVCLLELCANNDGMKTEASKLMNRVPSLRQKIAGKSIPLEVRSRFFFILKTRLIFFQKFVARKARKFQMQGNRLALSGLEMAYIFHGIAEAPRSVIAEKMLPEIDTLISELQKFEDKDEKKKEIEYSNGNGGYWDDYCLAMFLRGVCLRYVAYPVRTSILRSRYTRG